jgi:hypothetical protein
MEPDAVQLVQGDRIREGLHRRADIAQPVAEHTLKVFHYA